MTKSATGVLDRPEKTTKIPSETQQTKTRDASKRRGGARIREASASNASKNRELGMKGEEAAARFLYHRGYEILERNWTCFAGEAGIIAKDDDMLVFVEVKTRRDASKGFPREEATKSKRERYEKIALAYISEYGEIGLGVRFDVVSIVVVGDGKALIRHHINAFSVD